MSGCIYERYILIAWINRSLDDGVQRSLEDEEAQDAIGQGPAGYTLRKRTGPQAPASRSACLFALGRIGLLKINDSRADVNMIGCVSWCESVRVGVRNAATGSIGQFFPMGRVSLINCSLQNFFLFLFFFFLIRLWEESLIRALDNARLGWGVAGILR